MAKSIGMKKTPAGKAVSGENSSSKNAPAKSSVAPGPADARDSGLDKLLLDGIKDLYWAENHLVKVLPKMIRSAFDADLQAAIKDHLEITKGHVTRLEQVFDLLGKNPQAKKCDAMEGLSKEGEGIIESTEPGSSARDQGIIMASQKVEHYEIASYTGLSKLATNLGHTEIASLLQKTLAEEKESDKILTAVSDAIAGNGVKDE